MTVLIVLLNTACIVSMALMLDVLFMHKTRKYVDKIQESNNEIISHYQSLYFRNDRDIADVKSRLDRTCKHDYVDTSMMYSSEFDMVACRIKCSLCKTNLKDISVDTYDRLHESKYKNDYQKRQRDLHKELKKRTSK